MKAFSALSTVVVCLSLVSSGKAQNAPASFLPAVQSQAASGHASSCKPLELQTAAELTLHQRTCLYGRMLLSPSMGLRAAFDSAYGQIRKTPVDHEGGLEEFGHRFETYYAQMAAQYTGEAMAGYLAGEDPRFRPSHQNGIWNRTWSAFLNVVTAPGNHGGAHLALAPIAGSLSSGLVSLATYSNRNGIGDGLRRSGLVYSGYIGTALMHEFQPDLTFWANHLLHRKKQD